jgi:diguanylate cyclase
MLNRLPLFETLEAGIADAEASGRPLGLLLVRLRRLRETNRLFGYDVGEAFVDAVQASIERAVRTQDRVFRIGDGEFAVLLPALRDRNHAALAAAKLVRVLQSPLEAMGQSLLPLVSVGIAAAPLDAADAQALCRCADQACEEANLASERFAFYRPPRTATDLAHADLRDALAGNRLELYLQPMTDLRSGRTDRCEALARWSHPVLGTVAPDVFVRLAEQTGLIGELTRWSLNATLRHLSEALEAADADRVPSVAVNVAVEALRQPGFVEQVLDLLRFWDVPASHLGLEITESGLMTDPAQCRRTLGRLREHGIGVAIDDFGTGYSSMAYLRDLPASELKIDRSFVMDMRRDPRAEKLVASMIDVSHHLGMTAVAEGVEDADTLALLRTLGCDHAQGYHVGRPVPAAEAMERLVQAP